MNTVRISNTRKTMGSHWVLASETAFLSHEDRRPDCRDWAREKQTGGRKDSEITDTKLYGDFSSGSGSIN